MRRSVLWSVVVAGGMVAASVADRSTVAAASAVPTQSSIERLADGIRLPVAGGFLRLQIKSDDIVRVLFSKVRDPRVDPMMVVGPGGGAAASALDPFGREQARSSVTLASPRWRLTSDAGSATIATNRSSGTTRRRR